MVCGDAEGVVLERDRQLEEDEGHHPDDALVRVRVRVRVLGLANPNPNPNANPNLTLTRGEMK